MDRDTQAAEEAALRYLAKRQDVDDARLCLGLAMALIVAVGLAALLAATRVLL